MNNTSIDKIYPKIDEIHIFEDDSIDRIDNMYKKRFCADKSELSKQSLQIDIDEVKELNSGRYTIFLEGAHFEIFFHKGDSSKMYVMMESARRLFPEKSPVPRFQRWSWGYSTPYSWVVFSDPMYYEYDNLMAGWFYGNNDVNYRSLVVRIIKKICNLLGIDGDNVVFYGSSSGGTAAIHCAAIMKKGTAVAINPQLNFESENQLIRQFHENVSGVDLLKPDRFLRNDPCRVIHEAGKGVQFIITENCRSAGDMNHLKYLSQKNHLDPVYGLSRFGNTTVLVYDSDSKSVSPHSAMETNNIFFFIDYLTNIVKNTELIDEYKPLFRLVIDLWKEHYILADRISDANRHQSKQIIINNITLPKSSEEKYKCYKYSDIEKNSKYTLEIKKEDIFCTTDIISIGLYDSKKKEMVICDNYPISKDIFFSFTTGKECSDRHITIFSGIRGKTNNNMLKIKKIIITKE